MSRRRPPRVLTTVLLLACIDAGLRVFGFTRVLRAAGVIGRVRETNPDATLIESTFRRVLTATALYPGRSQCLEQSVAGYILLRRRGFDVHLRIGVQPYPFAAHAWLELDGKPLTESEEVVRGFAVMPEVAI